MKKLSLKRIGSFNEFCEAKKLIKEGKEVVSIDVPFYNEAIEMVLGEIHGSVGDPIVWGELINYLKKKNDMIGRNEEIEEEMVIAHIRDILFRHYGSSFIMSGISSQTSQEAETSAKALIFSQLAGEILSRIKIECGVQKEVVPESESEPVATISLADAGEVVDDFYFENIKTTKRYSVVSNYEDYTKAVNESVAKISCDNDKTAVEHVLNELERKAGSLNIDDVLRVAEEEKCSLTDYINNLAHAYILKNVNVELDGETLNNKGDQKLILKNARMIVAHKIASEILPRITKDISKKQA